MSYSDMDLLRFSVIGSVDDGKSTLIGRLLYDSKSIFEDQLLAIEESSKRRGFKELNLALLTDGLQAEREQGITIDVAYRYFHTPKRKFIIADCPGHMQFTRNMITGTSNMDLSVILIDARFGIVEQTKRHTYVASLMQIKNLIICVNKMDLVNYSEDKFLEIKKDFEKFIEDLNLNKVSFIPISALDGDNIVNTSEDMPWYNGDSLLSLLETTLITEDLTNSPARFPVQRVIRPESKEFPDFRGYAGRVEGGVFRPGDEVTLMPSGFKTKINKICSSDDDNIQEAFYPMSTVITLDEDYDLSRGDMIIRDENNSSAVKNLLVMVCWFGTKELTVGSSYLLQQTTKITKCKIKKIHYKLNINTLDMDYESEGFSLNDIGLVSIKLSQPIFIEEFSKNKGTGSIILIDEFSNNTVDAGMVQPFEFHGSSLDSKLNQIFQ